MSPRPTRQHAKPRRLKDFSYRGHYRYFITVRCHRFEHHFAREEVIGKMVQILRDTARQKSFLVWAYCFMPDHMHLLIEGNDDDSDMKGFVFSFKQKTAHWFKTVRGIKLWAANYYEHVLRNDEVTAAAARYIIQNPVRKGIVEDCTDYPYSGSLELEDISSL